MVSPVLSDKINRAGIQRHHVGKLANGESSSCAPKFPGAAGVGCMSSSRRPVDLKPAGVASAARE
jgi:hypothetical protein